LTHPAIRASLKTAFRPRQIAVLAALCLALSGILPAPVAARWVRWDAPPLTVPADSEAGRVITTALGKLHARWTFGAKGPAEFDCSGFVFYVFKQAGLRDRIGYKRKGARAYRNWFAKRGWRSNGDISKAQPGDILIWGNGHHAGIYMGDNWAVSALINPWGVSIHRPLKLDMKLTDVLHVQISRESGSAPTPTPSPTPTAEPSPSATPEPTPTPTPAQ
jgi:hypothetical protein